ncbi:hypothetical protein PVAP13_7KG033118 [Panicum virgatum]|uniref:Uncharacterized protein n=1 Tax=Panicum virgatum TaxID=38727 RepID=A0A8T0QA51_PANVG|nr:hypothetical protein PVAP13_7KG033118 [Panicum virgatum]
MIEPQSTNQTPQWFSLEQHRLQLGRVLQLCAQVSQQQEMSLQNAILSNLLTTDALLRNVEEVVRMRLELQRIRENQETSRHAWDQLLQLVVLVYEMNEALVRMIATLQQEMNSHVSGPGDEASSVARPCALHLTACPICGAVKDDAIETQFI